MDLENVKDKPTLHITYFLNSQVMYQCFIIDRTMFPTVYICIEDPWISCEYFGHIMQFTRSRGTIIIFFECDGFCSSYWLSWIKILMYKFFPRYEDMDHVPPMDLMDYFREEIRSGASFNSKFCF